VVRLKAGGGGLFYVQPLHRDRARGVTLLFVPGRRAGHFVMRRLKLFLPRLSRFLFFVNVKAILHCSRMLASCAPPRLYRWLLGVEGYAHPHLMPLIHAVLLRFAGYYTPAHYLSLLYAALPPRTVVVLFLRALVCTHLCNGAYFAHTAHALLAAEEGGRKLGGAPSGMTGIHALRTLCRHVSLLWRICGRMVWTLPPSAVVVGVSAGTLVPDSKCLVAAGIPLLTAVAISSFDVLMKHR